MIILNPKLLATFRVPGCCEVCKRWCAKRELHHVFSTGSNGGPLDIPVNLIAVGPMAGFDCLCHSKAQRYILPRVAVLEIVALREGVTVDWIKGFIFWIRRQTKPLGGAPTYEELVEAFAREME